MNEDYIFGTGAIESKHDVRTIQHSDLTMITAPLISGGYDYSLLDIENQHKVGVCCAASLVQLVQKMNNQ